MLINKGFLLFCQARKCAIGNADNRCQSTPAINHSHCACVNVKQCSSDFGQINRPLCKRRWHNHTPVPSHSNTLMRLRARLQNIKAEPAQGACCKDCCTSIDKPSMPRRISTGSAANQIFPGLAINPGISAIPLTIAAIHLLVISAYALAANINTTSLLMPLLM